MGFENIRIMQGNVTEQASPDIYFTGQQEALNLASI